MKLGDTIFNGNQFKNIILNSVSFKRLILEGNLVWSYFSIAIKSFKTRILADGGTYEGESILEDKLQEITPSLFDSASLVITPNGVKTSKLYSIKPNNGTGDLDVVRATSATRVNEQGLIEIPVTNLVLRSEEFNDVYWTKSRIIIIENTTIAPSGTLTADTFAGDGGTLATRTLQSSSISVTSGITYTFSVYLKKNTNNFIQLFCSSTAGGMFANFNIENGIIGTVGTISGTNPIPSIVNFGNGWFRCSITITSVNSGNAQFGTYLVTDNNAIRNEQNTLSTSVFIWGAQLEQGTTATEYIPTTSVIRTKFAGITQDGGSASNIPRIDYTNGSCPSILVEPQRTNLLLRSEEFDNASWNKVNSSITANTTISPNGVQDADTINLNTSGAYLRQLLNIASSTTYSYSIFIKKSANTGNKTFFLYYNNNNGSPNNGNFRSIIDLTNLTITTTAGGTASTGRPTIISSNLQSFNNDFYRAQISFTTGTSGGNTISEIGLEANGVPVEFFAWGAQLEAGSNATSYIPTTTSSVTRNADIISKSGISNLIGQTEGTIYYNLSVNSINNASKYIGLSDGTTNNRILIGHDTGISDFRLYYNSSGITSFTYTGSNWATGVVKKIAIVYATNNFKLFIDGVLVYTNNSITTFNSNNLTIFQIPGVPDFKLNTIGLWKTALTNTQAIQLTTL